MALACGERLLEAALDGERSHASDLFPALEHLRCELGAELGGQPPRRAIARVCVGIGPGSYTGLRVGVACAQALAWASGAELVGVPSFDVCAFDALRPGERGAVVRDARAGAYSFAAYERTADDVVSLVAPRAIAHGSLAAQLSDGWLLFADERGLAEARAAGLRAARALAGASARTLLLLGRARAPRAASVPPETLEPLYLRAFGEEPR